MRKGKRHKPGTQGSNGNRKIVSSAIPSVGSVESAASAFLRMKRQIRADVERLFAGHRAELLLDLANLSDNNCELFRSRWYKRFKLIWPDESDSSLLEYRDQLRKIWSHDDPFGEVLHNWLRQVRLSQQPSWILSAFADGTHSAVPNYLFLPLSLAMGASELAPKMAVCANLECPQSYFLKKRKTQKFCDRPACLAYGQREHKKKWWHDHGDNWREKSHKKHKISRIKKSSSRRN